MGKAWTIAQQTSYVQDQGRFHGALRNGYGVYWECSHQHETKAAARLCSKAEMQGITRTISQWAYEQS